jgi:N-acetylglucosaminyl-diphospho-decaprenol L-rhamnosyltransferase
MSITGPIERPPLHTREDSTLSESELDLTVIIVSYNTRERTVNCIRSIQSSTVDTSYEIIVVDNASTDGSVDSLRKTFPNIQIIAASENLGFARANNLAEERARGRRLLLLNPDTMITSGAVDNLDHFASANPDDRLWGGLNLHEDGTPSRSCSRRHTLWNAFCFATGLSLLLNHPEEYRGWAHDSVRPVEVISGCFLLIDRVLWKELHGFDPTFFMYGEDEDLCLRARQFGARPTFTPSAKVIHHGSASESDEAEKQIKLMAGEITLMKRHWAPLSAELGRLIYLTAPHPRWLLYGILGYVKGRPDLRRRAAMWWRLWQSRERWMNGWPDNGWQVPISRQ